jgi:hypothetical protein
LLIKGGDGHAETPAAPSHNPCAGGQLKREAVDGFHFDAIDDPANNPVIADPIQIAILPAGALSADLLVEREPPEVPVNIIGRSKIFAHHWRSISS